MPSSVADHVLAVLSERDDIEMSVRPGDRFLAVCIMDDDTVAYRRVTSHATCQEALAELADPSPQDFDFYGEGFIDLHADSIRLCYRPGHLTDDGFHLAAPGSLDDTPFG